MLVDSVKWTLILLLACMSATSADSSTVVGLSDKEENYPRLCHVCKCIQITASKENKSRTRNKYKVLCHDINAVYELSRSDAWPITVPAPSGNGKLPQVNLTTTAKLPDHELYSLSLTHNEIVSVPDRMFQTYNLVELNLGYNRLSEMKADTLVGTDNLKVLSLQHNNFDNIDWLVFNSLHNLEELYLQDNYINKLNGTTNLQQLKVLNLSGNALQELPEDTCFGLTSLQILHVADNDLTILPQCFLKLEALTHLVIDGNKISSVPANAFHTLRNLHVLRISYSSELTEIHPAALKGLSSLEQFRFSHNPQLVTIPSTLLIGEEATQHDWKITDVDLSYNRLTSIPSDLAPWAMLDIFDIQGNPLNCSCSAQWMLDALVPILYKKNSSMLENARCTTPFQHQGKRLVHWLGHSRKAFCDDGAPAPQAQVALLQSGSSHGMLIALSVVAGLGLVLLIVGVVLQRRANQQRKEIARKYGRCANPRNGRARLVHPTLQI